MPSPANVVSSRLDSDRRDLLDLSLRNPLLNYRLRARGLELVGESPAQLFRVLMQEGKRLTFLPGPIGPGPDASTEDSPTPSPLPPEDGGEATVVPPAPKVAASQADLKLQTALPADPLQAKLLAIFHAARTSLEEQGVNTLFLALGMLRWAEPDARGVILRAPLLLVPVALERSNARERFRLRPIEADLEVNLSLAEKLKADFQVAFPEVPDASALEVDRYFDAVAEAVRGEEGWSVDRESVVLGFFSFGKFLMYHDLDEESWPEGAKPGEHPILRALLHDGFREPEPAVGDDRPLDPLLDPSSSHLIVDADSSQTMAILDVNQGRNLVIQGPPGTGKSQTITNLIAEAIGRGKSVLFVAEKMAALDVVKRRLDASGVGDACLELHSHKSSKKAVLDELRRTLALGRPKLGAVEDDFRMLAAVRDRLNAYAEAVNTPIGESGVTPYAAFGELLRLREPGVGAAPVPLDIPSMPSWSRYDLKRREALVEELQSRMAVVGVPRAHPFWGSRRTLLLPTEVDRLRELLLAATRASAALRDSADKLAGFLRLPPASDQAEVETLIRAARRAAKAVQVQGTDVCGGDWLAHRGEIEELLGAGAALTEFHQRHDAALVPGAWDQDLHEARRDLNDLGRHWWKFFSASYRRARKALASLCRAAPPEGLEAQLALIDAVQDARRQRETIRRHEALAARLFGPRWQGERSHWEGLAKLSKWAIQLHLDVRARRLPEPIIAFLASRPDVGGLEPLTVSAKEAQAAFLGAVRLLAGFLEFDAPARFGIPGGLEDVKLGDLEAALASWRDATDDLPTLVAFNHLAARCREDELAGVVAIAEAWPEAGRHLVNVFQRHGYEGLLKKAFRERPALAGFDGRGQEHAIGAFCDLDRRSLRHNRARLAAEHWQRLPRHDGLGQLAVLKREFEKKARHLPLRQLLLRAGNAVKAIKPVFLMSPLSIAAYLAPGSLQFDLVIFDEASQVRPVEALGAILRGRQAVVVGDSRQLPPTQFFDRLVGSDESDEDDDASGDVESVLGLFVAQDAPQRMLRWHYRSRHESLIAVSNREFYDDQLIVFPSPDAARRDAGLVLRHLPDTTYDRGLSRTNPGEAEAVARAVMEHARTQWDRPPDRRLTLGVAAFSVAQMELIREQLEQLRRDDPSTEDFFTVGGAEPFFVKNLENVQGDERDVIFISIGYGRTADGAVAMNFGPLNGEGGERRLNVLITRARLRCEVFTNLTADDIDTDRARSRGVRALKTFLAFAETGTLEAPGSTEEAADAPFEESVRSALGASGCAIKTHVGSTGFALDMAVVDPERPGRYLLGIETDGASYHDARSARDRDRLRPQVLESLGWRLHRVWSADWGRNPSGELRRTLAAIDEARRGETSDPPGSKADHAAVYEREEEGAPESPAPAAPAYRVASLDGAIAAADLGTAPVDRVASWVAEVVAAEGPVHTGEVVRRLVEASGAKRTGGRMVEAIEAAWTRAVAKGRIERRGDFLWPKEMTRPTVRDRSGLPSVARKLDLIAPEEIMEAVETVVADALGIEPDAIPPAVGRLLGFARASDEMRGRITEIVNRMIEENRLTTQGSHLVVADSGDRGRSSCGDRDDETGG